MRKILLSSFLILSACASTGPKRVVLDSSGNKPDWVSNGKLTWEEGDSIFFAAKQTVRGDQREGACRDLASMDTRETMLKGIANEVRGQIDNAVGDISENAEIALGKVRSENWKGRLNGFQDQQTYFERYQIRDSTNGMGQERIDCYVLAKVSKVDYAKTKQEVLNKVVALSPEIKAAMVKSETSFFNKGE